MVGYIIGALIRTYAVYNSVIVNSLARGHTQPQLSIIRHLWLI